MAVAVPLALGALGASLVPLEYAAIGFAIGSSIGQALVAPDIVVEGPRLGDLQPQGADYGASIPRVVGRQRVGGTVIWQAPVIEHKHEQSAGGKGGSQTQVSYTYTLSFAVLICEGEADVVRIYRNKKLIWEGLATATVEAVLASAEAPATIYRGTETQEPDPLIVAHEGETSAYRGSCYLVFEDMDVTDTGGRPPLIEAEVVTRADRTYGLGTIDDAQAVAQAVATELGASLTGNPDVYALAGWTGNALLWHLAVPSNYTGQSGTVVSYAISRIRQAPDGSIVDHSEWQIRPPDDDPISGVQMIHGSRYFVALRGIAPQWWGMGLIPKHTAIPLVAQTPLRRLQDVAGGDIAPRLGPLNTRLVAASERWCYSVGAGGDSLHVHDLEQWALVSSGLAWSPYHARASIDLTAGHVVEALHVDTAGAWCRVNTAPGVYEWRLYDSTLTLHGTWPDSGARPLGDGLWGIYGGATQEILEVYRPAAGGTWDPVQTVDLTGAGSYGADTIPAWSIGSGLYYVGGDWIYLPGVAAPLPVGLDEAVGTFLDEAGIGAADRDLSALAGISVTGCSRPKPMSARAAIDPLRWAFAFDLIESEWLIKGKPRGGAPVLTVDEDDLGATDGADVAALATTTTPDAELPRRLHIRYLDSGRDFQPSTQRGERITDTTRHEVTRDLTVALSADEAAQVADVQTRIAWRERHHRVLALPPAYIALEPGDVIRVPYAGTDYELRLTQVTAGVFSPIEIEATDSRAADYTSTLQGGASSVPTQTLTLPGAAELAVLDIPALRDADLDAGLYYAVGSLSAGWPGGVVYRSPDGSTYESVAVAPIAVPMGRLRDVLPAADPNVWDRGAAVRVRMWGGAELASVTDAEALARGPNTVAIGVPGRWEIVTFRDAVLVAPGEYEISMRLRGRRGTEAAIGQHQIGDWFIVLDGRLRRSSLEVADLGATFYHDAATLGQALDASDAQALVHMAAALQPLSPCNVRGARNGAGDLAVSWVRRTRYSTAWRIGYAPLGEQSESYEVDVLDGAGSVLRTLASSSPAVTYSAGDQSADGITPGDPVPLRIYQLSAAVGRGFPREATL